MIDVGCRRAAFTVFLRVTMQNQFQKTLKNSLLPGSLGIAAGCKAYAYSCFRASPYKYGFCRICHLVLQQEIYFVIVIRFIIIQRSAFRSFALRSAAASRPVCFRSLAPPPHPINESRRSRFGIRFVP